MTTQQIDFFISVAESGSFTQTAEKYYTTQPTVSRQISLLEEEVGFLLLERGSKRLRLTTQGQIVLVQMKKARNLIAKGIESAIKAGGGLFGALHIGIPTGTDLSRFILPEAERFIRQNKDVDFSFELDSFSELRKKLDSGIYDLIYTHDFELPSIDRANYVRILQVEPVIVMSADHPLAKKENLTPVDFEGETFVLLPGEESRGREMEVLNSIEKVWGVHLNFRFARNINSLLFLVRSGFGLAALDSSMSCVEDRKFFCYRYDSEKQPKELSIVAVWKRDNNNIAIQEFLKQFTLP